MTTIIGIESTAHTFGVGIVKDGKIVANCRDAYTTDSGGIVPMDAAKHHERVSFNVYENALNVAKVREGEIDAIAFSQGPGLAPCLIQGIKFAKFLSKKLEVPLVPVNHCIAHLEVGRVTKAKDPVMLYTSGANTQIIAYSSGKFRIFGETLDVGVGNFIDTFARYAGIGFPGGPEIERLAKKGKNFIELPYSVKGMDISLSGILTNLRQKLDKMNLYSPSAHKIDDSKSTSSDFLLKKNVNAKSLSRNSPSKGGGGLSNFPLVSEQSEANYTLADLAFSLQETVFSMLVEVAERALAHTGKKELLLGGGVACNSRLQEMCQIMCKERGAKFFCPERTVLVDNGAMIAFLGEIEFNSGVHFFGEDAENLDIMPRQRTDEVEVTWR